MTHTYADAIASAGTDARLDELTRELTQAWGAGKVPQDEAERLTEAIEARRAALKAGATAPKPKPKPKPKPPKRKRASLFGDGRPRPMDRNVKVRIMHLARALMKKTEKGKAYGSITAKALAVLEALLWTFHNARSGLCFPSYEKIAAAADCTRSTVGEAIKALEAAGILSWVNRIVRVRDKRPGLEGRVRVIRTSNAYVFHDPKMSDRVIPSKSDFPMGTSNQVSSLSMPPAKTAEIAPTTPLGDALARFAAAFAARTRPA